MKDALDLAGAALDAPGRPAWIDEVGTPSFGALAAAGRERVERLRAAGVSTGDRVLVTPSLDRASALTMLAVMELRATLVLAHPRWSASELGHAIELTSPRLIVRGEVEEASEARGGSSDAVIVFTSGTTGRPKGVRLSRRALLAAAEAHGQALPWQDEDRWLLAMPLAHVGGLGVILRCVAARRTIVLGPDRFDPDVLLGAARRHDATLLSLVPTMLERILPAGPPPRVGAVLLGGAACPPALLARGRAAGWPLLPTYGLSECCAQVCTQRLEDPRAHGVGPPLPGVQVRIEDGVVEVRGATRMDGFVGEPPLAPDAWYRTGDTGFLDPDDHLHATGRLDDRIVTGGENVDPLAVENALLDHPAVAAACVVGVDDPQWGQRVSAVIVARAPSEPEQLRAHLEGRIARFAVPRSWIFADAIPVTPAGKPDRRAARRLFGSG